MNAAGKRRLISAGGGALGAAMLLFACGSRTGLFIDEGIGSVNNGPEDARDGGRDGIALDALPPIDVVPRPDADRTGCPDADTTYVYVVTDTYQLEAFDPSALTFRTIGRLACPSSGGATPFSMAVDRTGIAYVLYDDGNLYRVSTATGACLGTEYAPHQQGWNTFGMGFASDFGGPSEHLYVVENDLETFASDLGRIDVDRMLLAVVGGIQPPVPRAELTGTGDGRLFAFWPNRGAGQRGSHIAEVDKQSAAVLAQSELPIGESGDAFAFAFWGGDFWIFTGTSGSNVARYRPADGTTRVMMRHPSSIVGAGVSTCAPQL
jgi:hypothetical protein